MELTRRNFVAGAAGMAAGLATMSAVPALASETADSSSSDTSGASSSSSTIAAEVTEAPMWLSAEPDISEDQISQTIEADVVVLGGGTGGLYVGCSCAEKGLNTIIVEKTGKAGTVRNDWGSIGSKYQLAEGTEIDPVAVVHYTNMYTSHWIDERLTWIWAKESGAAVDWVGGVMEDAGAVFLHEGGYEPDYGPHTYPKFPTGHSAHFDNLEKGIDGSTILSDYFTTNGGTFYFNTAFVKFEHDGKKVTAAIALNEDGSYTRFVGTTGIVLATGGYQGDPAMMNQLQPHTCSVVFPPAPYGTCGDGIKACLWMGADMDVVHTSACFDRCGLLPNETPATATTMGFWQPGSQPWLKVNLAGERFMNESALYDYAPHASSTQPGKCYNCIFDSNWWDQIKAFETVGCSRMYPFPNGSPNGALEATDDELKANVQSMFDGLIEQGMLQTADTIEELAKKLNLPADALVATVDRYNELAAAGEDTDFYKDAYRLLPVEVPPFFGIRQCAMVLSTMDGIHIDLQMRPLDADGVPFEGLYLTGDVSGSHFACTYPNLCTGFVNGHNLTFARRIARILNGESVDLEA